MFWDYKVHHLWGMKRFKSLYSVFRLILMTNTSLIQFQRTGKQKSRRILSANDIQVIVCERVLIIVACDSDLSLFFQQLHLIGERDEVPIHFCDKCGLPVQLYGRMVCILLS